MLRGRPFASSSRTFFFLNFFSLFSHENLIHINCIEFFFPLFIAKNAFLNLNLNLFNFYSFSKFSAVCKIQCVFAILVIFSLALTLFSLKFISMCAWEFFSFLLFWLNFERILTNFEDEFQKFWEQSSKGFSLVFAKIFLKL